MRSANFKLQGEVNDRPLYLPTLLPGPCIPISSNAAHEHDAGVHVEEEGKGASVAVDQSDGDGDGEIC